MSRPSDPQAEQRRAARWLALKVSGRRIAAAVPVILVNVVAFAGQLAFLREHLPWGLAGQVLMAVTLESIAVYLAWQAHLAQLANDSALRLRLAAYGFAAVIAAMNYSHYAGPGWSPTFAAVGVALCSAASPWLWGIHTRRVSRDQLMKAGLIEPHALRLGATRWLWHPLRSARVMFSATWEGETDPATAIAALPLREDAPEKLSLPATPQERATEQPAPPQGMPHEHPAPVASASPKVRQPAQKTGAGKGVPPNPVDVERARQYLHNFQSVDELPSARELQRKFFEGKHQRACIRLRAEAVQARADGRSHLIPLPDAADPGHMNGKVEAVG